MSGFLTLDEFTNALKLVKDKLKGHESTPVAMALISCGVDFLMKTRKPEGSVREFVEKCIDHSRDTTIVMPSQQEIAIMLGGTKED